MLIPELNRHLYVCGVRDVPPILRRDPRFWNIISIFDPTDPAPPFIGARQVLRLSFYDVDDGEWAAEAGARAVQPQDLEQIFAFVDARPGEAMLVHCRAGVSRSTAVALALLIRGQIQAGSETPTAAAIAQLLQLRPHGQVLRRMKLVPVPLRGKTPQHPRHGLKITLHAAMLSACRPTASLVPPASFCLFCTQAE